MPLSVHARVCDPRRMQQQHSWQWCYPTDYTTLVHWCTHTVHRLKSTTMCMHISVGEGRLILICLQNLPVFLNFTGNSQLVIEGMWAEQGASICTMNSTILYMLYNRGVNNAWERTCTGTRSKYFISQYKLLWLKFLNIRLKIEVCKIPSMVMMANYNVHESIVNICKLMCLPTQRWR